jgi:glycosyltransferase involved in cell wall biosynthesis
VDREESVALMSVHVTVVIPVYNEEAILHAAVVELVDQMRQLGKPYEILLAENGSTDGTVLKGQELASRFPEVSISSLGEPNYGLALKQGILRARGRYVICEEIDLCDADFHQRALALLESGEAKLVIGSKAMAGASDERPLSRRAGTLVLNGLLRVTLGFKGTDTHGLKAFDREALLPIVNACLVEKDIFASELVIRAERACVPIREIPVRVLEMRPPTIGLVRRVPNVLRNLAKLFVAIRIKGEG